MWVHNASAHVNEVSQWPTIVAVCCTLSAIMTVIVSMRLYVRAVMIKSLGPDDYIMAVCMIFGIIYSGLCIGQSRWGLGLPIALRPAVNLNKYSEINFAGRPFYQLGVMGFKVALCFAYLRITGNSIRSNYRKFIWAVMVFTILTHVGGMLVLLFQCHPIEKSWRPRTVGKCLPNDITFYVLAAVSIVCDLIIFTLPIPLLMRVQINLRRKLGLIGIFMLGLFTTVCSIMRMVQIITIAKNGNSTMLVLWGTIELNVGIILTCLPSLTPLFTFFAQKTKNSSYGLSYGRKKHTGTDHSINMPKYSQHSQTSESTAVPRSDSQENILQGKGDIVITRTTEVEVHEYDKARQGKAAENGKQKRPQHRAEHNTTQQRKS